jgi:hypothetical protein
MGIAAVMFFHFSIIAYEFATGKAPYGPVGKVKLFQIIQQVPLGKRPEIQWVRRWSS